MGNISQTAKIFFSEVIKFVIDHKKQVKATGITFGVIVIILVIAGIIVFIFNKINNKNFNYENYKADKNENKGINLRTTKNYGKALNNI